MKNALSYWKRYDLVYKHFSFKKIFNKIFGFAKNLGEPFKKKSKRGAPFKVSPIEYATYIAFEIITHNSPYRDMELGSELYVNKHIDHSTFGKNFIRIPYEYFLKLLEKTSSFLEKLLGQVNLLIADSTGIHGHTYYDCDLVEKKTRRKKRFKINSLIASHPENNLTYVRTAIGSDLRLSDCEGAKQMLEKQPAMDCIFMGDKGYDYERVYQVCKDKGIKTNIKPCKHRSKRNRIRKRMVKHYSENLYKNGRGVVESVFGGLSNKGLLNTKLRKLDCIRKHGLIGMIRHNLFTIFRSKVELISSTL